MIEIIPVKKKKKKQEPYYILKYEYMIGDVDGYTSEKVEISADNPHLERYLTLLDKLESKADEWGIGLDESLIEDNYKRGIITEDEFEFLKKTMFERWAEEEEDEYLWEFCEGVQSDTEYSFLTYEGYKLTYVDEYGVKHKTKITDGTNN